jgi:DNA-binding response OmpR family regulator
MAERVLIIDDDARLAAMVSDYLTAAGFVVDCRFTARDGLAAVDRTAFDAIILDVMLPDSDGFEVCRNVRTRSQTPILMLTARGEETDRIVGLEVGADDYLPKTFSTRELLARLRSVTRRAYRAPAIQAVSDDDIVLGPLRIVPAAHTAFLNNSTLALTPVEFDLLLSLARSPGRVKSRDQLLEEIRNRDYEVFDRSIDVHISALRKKLGDDAKSPRFIRTFRTAGYMLVDPETPA